MKKKLIASIRALLQRFDVDVVYHSEFKQLKANVVSNGDLDFLLAMPADQTHRLLSLIRNSAAQFRQDLFVLSTLGFKRNGYFVEFGATDGLAFSNTLLLEKSFGWQGILAEPARGWHPALRANRPGPIETRCVWKDSNTLLRFNELPLSGLSGIAGQQTGVNGASHGESTAYEVQSISLTDMLEKYAAPRTIDYLSIDTEGSEFDILSHFDFSKYDIRVITCEHNFTPNRQRIHELLIAQGYERRHEKVSSVDDWYARF